jgi:hypothetical protein
MKRRKPNRSRRIVKKLLKRANLGGVSWNLDAVPCDGGKRWVSAQEMIEHDLKPEGRDHG